MKELLANIWQNIITIIQSRYAGFAEFAPFILGALAMFLLGLLLAELAARGIIRLSEKMRLEIISEKIGLKHFLHRIQFKGGASHVIAKAIKAYLIFLFFIEATKIAQLDEVAEFLTTLIGYVPDLMIALFIVLVGIRIGGTIQSIIRTSLSFTKSSMGNALGIGAKYTVIVFASLAALSQLQIAEILIYTLFIGFVAMLTIAGGLAFGLGGKDVVKELLQAFKQVEIKKIKKRIQKTRKKTA